MLKPVILQQWKCCFAQYMPARNVQYANETVDLIRNIKTRLLDYPSPVKYVIYLFNTCVVVKRKSSRNAHFQRPFFFTVSLHRSTPPGQEYQNNAAIKVYNCCCKFIGTDFKQLVPPLHKVY